jgi:HK97 family phage portal protein
MGLITRAVSEWVPGDWPQNLDPHDPRLWTSDSTVNMSQSGVYVTPDRALQNSTYWACIKVISEDVAGLPLLMYHQIASNAKQAEPTHPLADLLAMAPNQFQGSFEFIVFLTACALSWGNGFAQILPGRRGAVDSLMPLHPRDVTPQFDGTAISYKVRQRDGTHKTLLQDEVFLLPGFTIDDQGIFGVSVMRYARESLGAAVAADSYGSRFWSQDATPGGILQHPKTLTKQAAERLKADWNANHGGVRNARSTAVLEEGMEYKTIGMSNEDAQFLETRSFNITEICRWFRMKPHKIAHLEHATFSNIEEENLDHVVSTIRPWARRWEHAIRRQLIAVPQFYFAEFQFDDLLRANTQARFTAYQTATGGPIMTANEARLRENLNPLPGGDTLRSPLNMGPAGANTGAALVTSNGHHRDEVLP